MSTPSPADAAVKMPASAAATAPGRLMSLDALRGFDMFWIVGADAFGAAFRNLQAGAPGKFFAYQFDHAEWVGFTFYDLIFPLFVFMIGVSITLSLPRMLERESRSAVLGRILRRTVLMYLLGLVYYGAFKYPIGEFRFLGVLQRLALCYCATALLFIYVKPRGLIATALGLLVGYWALMTFVPVPGHGAGDYSSHGNLAAWVDQNFLPGRLHYGHYDPEGLLSTLPAIASCLIGALAGIWIQAPARAPKEKVGWLAAAGVALILLGWLWGQQFPVIKRIWTSSYVLVAGGWSLLLLAGFYLIIDVRGHRRWCMPFVWVGMNALTIYLISRFANFRDLAAILAGGQVSAMFDHVIPGLGGLVQAVVSVGLCVGICWFLYQKKVFVKL